MISATAAAGTNIKWYDVATGGTWLGTGASFTTPTISSTTTFYAEPNIGGGWEPLRRFKLQKWI